MRKTIEQFTKEIEMKQKLIEEKDREILQFKERESVFEEDRKKCKIEQEEHKLIVNREKTLDKFREEIQELKNYKEKNEEQIIQD